MSSTTIKVSSDTRDRIRSLGGATYEETIVAALDALEADRFWAQAAAAAEWRASLPASERQQLVAAEAEVDRAFASIERAMPATLGQPAVSSLRRVVAL